MIYNKLHYKIFSLILLSIIALLIIWFAPFLWQFEEESAFIDSNVRLALSLAICIIAILILYLIYFWERYRDLSATQDAQNKDTQPVQPFKLYRKFLQQFLLELKISLQILRSKPQRQLRNLPWFLLLGDQGSGKASLLNNMGLNFLPAAILSPLSLQPENLHTDYRWRVTKEAAILLMTTDLNSTSADENSPLNYWGVDLNKSAWREPLRLIKCYRRCTPLNAALLTLNLVDLLLEEENKKHQRHQALLHILQLSQSILQAPLPLYLILTHCDRVAGFQEFFNDLSSEDRTQIWGISFPSRTLSTPDQRLDYFNTEFDKLITRLQERLLQRLSFEHNAERRARLSYFPQQMEMCKSILLRWLNFDDCGEIRGIYFVSNTQKGLPHDLLLETISTQYGLSSPLQKSLAERDEPCFSQRLFSDIILPQASQLHDTAPQLQQLRKRWRAAAFAVLIGGAGLMGSYLGNQDKLESIQQKLSDYRQALQELVPSDPSFIHVLPLLNTASNIHSTYAAASHKWLLYFELYQPFKIGYALDAFLQHILSDQLLRRIAAHLENTLRANPTDAELLYETLKGYLVFSPGSHADPNWLRAPFTRAVNKEFANQPDAQLQFKKYLEDAILYPIAPLPLNQAVIESTRARLRLVDPAEFAYYELKQAAASAKDQFNPATQIGSSFHQVFTTKDNNAASLSRLYTLSGYSDLQGGKTKLLLKYTAETYRILGLDQNNGIRNLISQMSPALWRRYNTDYINAWDNLLNSIQIKNFQDLNHGIQILDTLLSAHSPLTLLLYSLKENSLPIRGHQLLIAPHFAAVNTAIGLPGKTGAQYTAALNNLSALRDYLIMLKTAPNTAQLEFQAASALLQNNAADNPIARLQRQAQELPAPLNQWLSQIADNSFALLLQGAHETINTAWRREIVPTYKMDIQNRFPFNKQANAVVSLSSFNNFFGASGSFAQFYSSYLAPFMDSTHSPWSQRQIGEHTLGLQKDVITQLEKAALIHNIYFRNGSTAPLLQFSIKPRYLDPQSSSVTVQCSTQHLIYQHGPQGTQNWQWPSSTETVNILFNDFKGQIFSRSFDGPWAWFKLLNSSSLQTTGSPGHYIWTIRQNRHQASFDLWLSNNRPAFNLDSLADLNLPDNI